LLYLNRYKEGHSFSHDVMRAMNLLLEQLQAHVWTCVRLASLTHTRTDAMGFHVRTVLQRRRRASY
jgi:hypothetical protein